MANNTECKECNECKDDFVYSAPPCGEGVDCEGEQCTEVELTDCVVHTETVSCGEDEVITEGMRLTQGISSVINYFCARTTVQEAILCGDVEIVAEGLSILEAITVIQSFYCDAVTLEEAISCGEDEVVAEGSLADQAIIDITAYFCSQITLQSDLVCGEDTISTADTTLQTVITEMNSYYCTHVFIASDITCGDDTVISEGEDISEAFTNLISYLCPKLLYDSGWIQVPTYDGVSGYGIAPLFSAQQLYFRIQNRTVFFNGSFTIPLSSDGGTTLETFANLYPSTGKVWNAVYTGASGGMTINTDGSLTSVLPVLPEDLRPSRNEQVSYLQPIYRPIRSVADDHALVLNSVLLSTNFTTGGEVLLGTMKDADDSATQMIGGDFTQTNLLYSLIDNVIEDDYAVERLNTETGVTITTAGMLVVGKTYIISNFVAGDDFTNVGAPANVTGVRFVATGTTPTVWANSSSIALDKSVGTISDQQYPLSFNGKEPGQLGGFLVPFTFSYLISESTTLEDIKTAVDNI